MKNYKKYLSLFMLSFFLVFSVFSQNQDSIILPDISSEILSEDFKIDSDAIPDFKVEPLKNTLESQDESTPLEPSFEKIDDVPEIVFLEKNLEESVVQDLEETLNQNEKNWIFGLGGDLVFSTDGFAVAPEFLVSYKKEKFFINGNFVLNLGTEAKKFFAIEALYGEIGFDLPKNFTLIAKTGLELYQCDNLFDFLVPMGIEVKYQFDSWTCYAELGNKTFKPFVSSFYGLIGGEYDFGLFKDSMKLEIGKKIGIENVLNFSTNWEKYKIRFAIEYILKENAYFSVGGIYYF